MNGMRMQRIAHRGGSRLAPENTLAAFRTALTLQIDAIELDVQMSRDGQLVVFHDNSVERLTNGEGNLLDLDFAYLRSLNAAAHFENGWPEPQRIPTLREVLQLAKNRVRVHIEIKASKRDGIYGRYPGIAEAVVREVQANNMLQQVQIISFDWPILSSVKSLEPSLQTALIVSKDVWAAEDEHALQTLIEQATTLGTKWIALDKHLFTEKMLGTLHKHKLILGLWTVNTLEEMRHFAAAHVDAITSDRPDLFAELERE